MTDKKKIPADGGGVAQGWPDGVSGSPDSAERGRGHGRSPGGESGGGAYPNPRLDKDPANSDFSGVQGEKTYFGSDNPNATNPRTSAKEEEASAGGSSPAVRQGHPIRAGEGTIDVVEHSGVAAAEASGKVATDAAYEAEQETPGGG
ncbi:MAG: hypothetical protein H0V46_06005 [Sphingomonas sp.]|nr:hypothetical protein [Sphingomonas sp.]